MKFVSDVDSVTSLYTTDMSLVSAKPRSIKRQTTATSTKTTTTQDETDFVTCVYTRVIPLAPMFSKNKKRTFRRHFQQPDSPCSQPDKPKRRVVDPKAKVVLQKYSPPHRPEPEGDLNKIDPPRRQPKKDRPKQQQIPLPSQPMVDKYRSLMSKPERSAFRPLQPFYPTADAVHAVPDPSSTPRCDNTSTRKRIVSPLAPSSRQTQHGEYLGPMMTDMMTDSAKCPPPPPLPCLSGSDSSSTQYSSSHSSHSQDSQSFW